MFDEHQLRADIVRVWGEHGAHADVFDYMAAHVCAPGEGVHPDTGEKVRLAAREVLPDTWLYELVPIGEDNDE